MGKTLGGSANLRVSAVPETLFRTKWCTSFRERESERSRICDLACCTLFWVVLSTCGAPALLRAVFLVFCFGRVCVFVCLWRHSISCKEHKIEGKGMRRDSSGEHAVARNRETQDCAFPCAVPAPNDPCACACPGLFVCFLLRTVTEHTKGTDLEATTGIRLWGFTRVDVPAQIFVYVNVCSRGGVRGRKEGRGVGGKAYASSKMRETAKRGRHTPPARSFPSLSNLLFPSKERPRGRSIKKEGTTPSTIYLDLSFCRSFCLLLF